jgi:hypothetical protein
MAGRKTGMVFDVGEAGRQTVRLARDGKQKGRHTE